MWLPQIHGLGVLVRIKGNEVESQASLYLRSYFLPGCEQLFHAPLPLTESSEATGECKHSVPYVVSVKCFSNSTEEVTNLLLHAQSPNTITWAGVKI